MLDVGGASTRPGAAPVDAEEERRRVLPVVEALAGRVARPLSVDTTTASVAAAALRAGATVVNDVSALAADPDMAHVVREHGATVVLMDNRLAPAGAPPGWHAPRVPPTADMVPAVGAWLARRVAGAEAAGINRGRLVLDPGLGFGKTPAQSLALVRRLARLRRHPGLAGLPLLVGPSRKGFIGHVLGLPVARAPGGDAGRAGPLRRGRRRRRAGPRRARRRALLPHGGRCGAGGRRPLTGCPARRSPA